MVTNAIISSDGSVLWMFPALIKTYCMLNVKYFPFDTQNCDIVFISWTHSGHELDVNHSPNFSNVVYYKSENQVANDKKNIPFVRLVRWLYVVYERPYLQRKLITQSPALAMTGALKALVRRPREPAV
jgi:hypothetical protein